MAGQEASQSPHIEAGSSSLDVATKLGHRREGHWLLRLYRDAGEAGGTFRSAGRPPRGRIEPGHGRDPERAREEAARRAGTTIRRYCAANRLNRLGTLTYATACDDQRRVRVDVGGFFRNLREAMGEPIPYLWVPEWHPGGHGLHVHFAVGRYIRHGVIKEAWGRGFVHIKLIGRVPIGQGQLGEARQAARYLAKYVRKGLADGREFGLHRYECAQGFQPVAEQLAGRTSAEVIELASERMGLWPELIWESRQADRWFGPPAVWARWDR